MGYLCWEEPAYVSHIERIYHQVGCQEDTIEWESSCSMAEVWDSLPVEVRGAALESAASLTEAW